MYIFNMESCKIDSQVEELWIQWICQRGLLYHLEV